MSKPAVLIVEDNKINALVLSKAIEPYCKPVHVTNDTQAFEAVSQHLFPLILMDINLGSKSLDGEQIMRRIRENPTFAEVKIFAVTSYANPGDKARFLEAGFDSYFSKPIRKDAIVAGVKEALAIAAA
ncbi:MAG: response regulator [Bacteroidota bacterium]